MFDKFYKKVFLLIFLVFLFQSLIFSEEKINYSIQLGFFDSQKTAEDYVKIVEDAGYSPLLVQQKYSWYHIYFGVFDYYVDALLYKQNIPTEISEEPTIVNAWNVNWTEEKKSQPTKGILPSVFAISSTSATEWQDYFLDTDSVYKKCEEFVNNSPASDEYGTYIEEQIKNCSETSPLYGYLLTRRGIYLLLKAQYDEAIKSLMPVCQGTILARKLDRIKSMKRVAWVEHRKGNRVKAYQAYREIEGCSGSELVKAQCRAEIAGLLLELSECEKGSLKETREYCQKIKQTWGNGCEKEFSIVSLVEIETYMKEIDYPMTLDYSKALVNFINNKEDCRREWLVAMCYIGDALVFTQKSDDAEYYYNSILATKDKGYEQFEAFDPYLGSELGLARIARIRKDYEKAKSYYEDVIFKGAGKKEKNIAEIELKWLMESINNE